MRKSVKEIVKAFDSVLEENFAMYKIFKKVLDFHLGPLTLLLLGLIPVVLSLPADELTYRLLSLIPKNSEIAVGIRKVMKEGEGPFQRREKEVKIEIDNSLPKEKKFAAICDKDMDLKDERFFLESGTIDERGEHLISRFITLNGAFIASNCKTYQSLPVVRIHEAHKDYLFGGKRLNNESIRAVIYYAPSLELRLTGEYL